MASSSPHEIVILGGNFGGINAAHYLLRRTIPMLQSLDRSNSYHITLVSPNAELFFKIGSPRALINSTLLPEEKIFSPIAQGFAKYTPAQFTFVQGIAESLDPAQRSVTVLVSNGGGTASAIHQTLHYDGLIISTGTKSNSPLWTYHDDPSLTKAALKSMHAALPIAKTVLIAGGGAVGVETAGEIAAAYPTAKITLLSGSSRLLQAASEATGARAQSYLEHNMHVEVLHGVRVVSSALAPASTGTTVTLDDKTTRTIDLFIDATGGTPNSSFLPPTWLDSTKRVLTRDAYFRVKGSGSDDVAGVYVIGDVVSGSTNSDIELDAMVLTMCSSVAVDLAGNTIDEKNNNAGVMGKVWAMLFGKSAGRPVQREFKPMKGTIVVPIGPQGGVGQISGWKVPSFMVKMVKAKSYLVELVDPLITGEKYAKP